MKRSVSWIPVALGFILTAGLLLRLHTLWRFGFWFDEAAVLSFLTPLKVPLFFFGLDDTWGRSFLVLLKLWTCISSSEAFLKLFSVAWAVPSLFLIYKIGRLIVSPKTGICAALLLCVSPAHIYYSQEVTGYSFSIFLALVSSYYFLRLMSGQQGRGVTAMYVLSTVGFIYAHFANLLLLAVQNLAFFAGRDQAAGRTSFRRWMLAQAAVLLACVPWMVIVALRFLEFARLNVFFWIPRPDLNDLLRSFMVFALGFNAGWKLQLAALAVLLYLSALIFVKRRAEAGMKYVFLWLLLPAVMLWLISQFNPVYLHRCLLFSLPALCLAAGAGLALLGKRQAAAICAVYVLFCSVSLGNYYRNVLSPDYLTAYAGVFPRRDFRRAARYVEENFAEGDIVLHISRASILPFKYYHRDRFPEFGVKLGSQSFDGWVRIWGALSDHQVSARKGGALNPLRINSADDFAGYRRIWLVASSWNAREKEFEGPHKAMADWFMANLPSLEISSFEGTRVYLFASSEKVPAKSRNDQ